MKTYLFQPLTPELKAQINANLARMSASQRFMGRRHPQCDFCAGKNPEFIYAADRLTTGQPQQCWRWLACPDCHADITANNFDSIYKRAAKLFGGSDRAEGVIRAVMIAFHADAITV